MRVLTIGNMYPPHHLGGYELAWRAVVEGLREAGHSVGVLTTDHRNPELDPAAGGEDDRDVHRELRWYWRDHRFPRLSLRERVALERHNDAVLERHLRAFPPDLVSWWAMGGMSLALIERVRRAGLPAIGFVHDEWMDYGPRFDAWLRAFGRPRPLALAAERLTGLPARVELGAAGRWLFNSEAMRRIAADAVQPLPDTGVVHPGVDRELFRPAPEREWRSRLLCVGRIDRRKGIDTAIRATAELEEARLTVCGPGDQEHLRELRALAEELGAARRVRFERRERAELPAAYAEADAVLFPVRWKEPFGLVPLEAMAVGRPVVATGTGGSAEYLRDGDNCLVFRPREDPEALAAAVRRLAADATLRARLREQGLATAARHEERGFVRAAVAEIEAAGG